MAASTFDSWTVALHTLDNSGVQSYGWAYLRKTLQVTRSSHGWTEQPYTPQWQFLDAATTSFFTHQELNQVGKQTELLDLRSPIMVVSPFVVLISLHPIAVLDLAGGCCRPAAPIAWMNPKLREYVLRAHDHVATEYGWLFLACHSHSGTYFHALAEAAPKLMWGLRLLHENPDVRVLHDSSFVGALLPQLNLRGRGVMYNGYQLARRITVPPTAQLQPGLLGALRRTLFTQMPTRVEPANASDYSVIVVRRSAITKYGGRALLNHDQLMLALRFVLLKETTKLLEWPPEGKTIAQALETWSSASVVIAPHGAGLANMIFMPRGSTVIEIIARGQMGQVYGRMARMLGHRYTHCYYSRHHNGTLNLSLPLPIREKLGIFTAFSLDLTYFMDECIQEVDFPQRKVPVSRPTHPSTSSWLHSIDAIKNFITSIARKLWRG